MTLLRSISLAAISTFFLGTSASAHDFWLKPGQYHLSEPGEVGVEFLIGHSDIVDPWNLRWDRVVSLMSYGPDSVINHQASIVPMRKPAPGLAQASFSTPGTYVLAFESYHSFSELEAEKFNDYATSEGLALVLSDRADNGTMEAPGRELYSRKAKTIIQVGNVTTDNVLNPVGHTLEIVPQKHPYDLGDDRVLPVQVIFRGEPLENALIDLTQLETGKEAEQEMRTDQDGMAEFTVPAMGKWKLNVIWGVPNPGNDRAEYESYFTSLTFGYPDSE